MSNIQIYPTPAQDEITDNPVSIGIDLGTTYALMAIIDKNNVDPTSIHRFPVQFVRFLQDSPFPYDQTIEDERLATIIAFYEGKPYVGNNLYHLKGHPEFKYKKNIFYHWKVEMGVDHHPLYPDAINEKLDMPYKIAGAIMNFMRRTYSQGNDYELDNVIITVPASFQANQRKDTIKAAAIAKIKAQENMLIDEPNAAFLGYFNRLSKTEKERWAREVKNKNVLVVDFGGGTLDLSILNIDFRLDTGITISNKAISRYNDLGGQDVDLLLAEEFLLPKLKKKYPDLDGLDLSVIRNDILPQLSVMAEDLKMWICDAVSLKVADGSVADLILEDIKVTRSDNTVKWGKEEVDLGALELDAQTFKDHFIKFFRQQNYSFEYLDKVVTTVSTSISEVVNKANETLDAIDFVLFVGGSSFNPFLSALVSEKLKNAAMLLTHEPDKLVAEGAAVYSYFLNQHNVSLISPITSDTIGVRLRGNQFHPLIESSQSLPQKVKFSNFKLQSNMTSEVLVPVCINGADYVIGEIRAKLDKFYPIDTVVEIEAEVTIDKVFKLKVFIEGDVIGEAEFDNPYAIGQLTEEEMEVYQTQMSLNQARKERNLNREKSLLRELISKHYEAHNYLGALENAERYIDRFDDQDSWVWNMKYILNNRLGRKQAAEKALKRALEIDPTDPTLHHNYSVLLESSDPKKALDYLTNLDPSFLEDSSIKAKKSLLKYDVEGDDSEMRAVMEEHKANPSRFNDFDKRALLSRIYRHLGEPYAYIDPKTKRKKEDDQRYLDSDNKPIEF